MIISIFINLILFYIFIYFFKQKYPGFTPQGIGSFLIYYLYLSYFLNNQILDINFSVIVILVFIYMFDDFKGLSPLIRVLLQFLAGSVIAYSILGNSNYLNIILISLIFVFFVNFLNFQDGLDLNIASIIWQLMFILYIKYFNLIDSSYFNIVISFLIVFTIFNNFHKIFIGDSGIFVITIIFGYFVIRNFTELDLSVFLPFLIPIIDFVYVLIKRVYLKENLLTRHEYHLYQMIGNKYNKYINFVYQNFIFFLIFFVYFKIQTSNWETISIILLSFFLYTFSRRIFKMYAV